jgi:hypothetical protein
MRDILDIPQCRDLEFTCRYKKREEYEQMLRLVSKYRKDTGFFFSANLVDGKRWSYPLVN